MRLVELLFWRAPRGTWCAAVSTQKVLLGETRWRSVVPVRRRARLVISGDRCGVGVKLYGPRVWVRVEAFPLLSFFVRVVFFRGTNPRRSGIPVYTYVTEMNRSTFF